jgi:hypothetical protein
MQGVWWLEMERNRAFYAMNIQLRPAIIALEQFIGLRALPLTKCSEACFLWAWQWLEVRQSGGDGSDPMLQPDQIKKKKAKKKKASILALGITFLSNFT